MCSEIQVTASSSEKRRRGLPPAMPRAAEAFMRAERRVGRLILTEVRIERQRQEVFRASRDGGRLRLRFAANEEDDGASSFPDGGQELETAPGGGGEKRSAAGGVVAVHGGCGNGTAGEFCQVVAGAAGRRRGVEVGAVVGIGCRSR